MRRRGLSLIDVVFTASLLAIVFMIILSLLPTAMYSVRQSEHRLQASALCLAILDECRAGPFSRLQSDTSADASTPGPLGDLIRRNQRPGDDGTVYTAHLEVGPAPHSSVPRSTLATVQVEVRWRERGQTLQIGRTTQISALNR